MTLRGAFILYRFSLALGYAVPSGHSMYKFISVLDILHVRISFLLLKGKGTFPKNSTNYLAQVHEIPYEKVF